MTASGTLQRGTTGFTTDGHNKSTVYYGLHLFLSLSHLKVANHNQSFTSYSQANEYLVKVPLIINGGHLTAVLCSVRPGRVEDQNVGRFSELSSVLQVAFLRRKNMLQWLIEIHNVTSQLKAEIPANFFQGTFHSAKA